jgi:hypothetical protein
MQVVSLWINQIWTAHAMCLSGWWVCRLILTVWDAPTMSLKYAHSYRRVGGSDFAQLLKVCFQKAGIDVFLDVDNLGQGQFDEQLWKRINAAKNVVLVWTKGCKYICACCAVTVSGLFG